MSHQPLRSIVITGITSGLGSALAEWFSARGHAVHGCGRRGLSQGLGVSSFRQLDIMDRKSLEDWAKSLCAEASPDLLIHNAATIHRDAPLWELPSAELDATLAVNIKGTFNVLQAFLPTMVAARKGVVITLSSGAGRVGISGISGYCATKWAVEGLTKSLAEELPEPMAAIPLSPGIVDTDMLRINFGEAASRYPKPHRWVETAGPMILGLNRTHNGQSLTVEMQEASV